MAGRKVRGWTKRCRRRKSLGELSCLRLHFERFEKLGISQTFNPQKSTLFTTFFGMAMRDMMSLFKKKKKLKIRIIRRFDA